MAVEGDYFVGSCANGVREVAKEASAGGGGQ
jgi:hypothetical protein